MTLSSVGDFTAIREISNSVTTFFSSRLGFRTSGLLKIELPDDEPPSCLEFATCTSIAAISKAITSHVNLEAMSPGLNQEDEFRWIDFFQENCINWVGPRISLKCTYCTKHVVSWTLCVMCVRVRPLYVNAGCTSGCKLVRHMLEYCWHFEEQSWPEWWFAVQTFWIRKVDFRLACGFWLWCVTMNGQIFGHHQSSFLCFQFQDQPVVCWHFFIELKNILQSSCKWTSEFPKSLEFELVISQTQSTHLYLAVGSPCWLVCYSQMG